MRYRTLHCPWVVAAGLLHGCVKSPTESVDSMPSDAMMDSGRDARTIGDSGLDAGCPGCAECREDVDCSGETNGRIRCSDAGMCVACAASSHCPRLDAPRCEAFACLGCATQSDCARFETTPACDLRGACVECTAEQPGLCMSTGRVCETDAGICVECNANSDCKGAQASKCEVNVCRACTEASDCAHIQGKPACHAGVCVACTPETEAIHCGETACDPDALTCTGTPRSSLATCRACRSDSECVSDHKCIAVPFGAADAGFYCMRTRSSGCANPYRSTLIVPSKNSSSMAEYCAHNTSVTTCEAVTALTSDRLCSPATVSADCGQGSRCSDVGGTTSRCTYACSTDLECPGIVSCNEESSADPYCGGR